MLHHFLVIKFDIRLRYTHEPDVRDVIGFPRAVKDVIKCLPTRGGAVTSDNWAWSEYSRITRVSNGQLAPALADSEKIWHPRVKSTTQLHGNKGSRSQAVQSSASHALSHLRGLGRPLIKVESSVPSGLTCVPYPQSSGCYGLVLKISSIPWFCVSVPFIRRASADRRRVKTDSDHHVLL